MTSYSLLTVIIGAQPGMVLDWRDGQWAFLGTGLRRVAPGLKDAELKWAGAEALLVDTPNGLTYVTRKGETPVAREWNYESDQRIAAALDPSGRTLAVSNANGELFWGTLNASTPIGRFDSKVLVPKSAALNMGWLSDPSVVWSPDGTTIAWAVPGRAEGSSGEGDAFTYSLRLRDRRIRKLGKGRPLGWNRDGLWVGREDLDAGTFDLWRRDSAGRWRAEARGLWTAAVHADRVVGLGKRARSVSPRVRLLDPALTGRFPYRDAWWSVATPDMAMTLRLIGRKG